MEFNSLRKAIIFCALVGVTPIGMAFGVEIYTIGSEVHSWRDAAWDEADPDAVVGMVEFEKEPGWIMPVEIDTAENIASKSYERGGEVSVPNVPLSSEEEAALEGIVNGDHSFAFDRKSSPGRKFYNLGLMLDIDLGARFGVDRIVFFPRMSEEYPFQDYFLRAYDIYLNDGTKESAIEGMPIFSLAEHNEENDQPVVEVRLPLQYVRYIRIVSLTNLDWEIDEVQVFGAGFVPEATYESQVFDFGDIATLGRMWWSERKVGIPERSRIVVRTRSGDDDTPLVYYRRLTGEEEVEVSWEEYEKLKPEEQGEIKYFTKTGIEVSRRDYEALPSEQKGEVRYYRVGGEVPLDKNGRPLTREGYYKLPPSERGSIKVDVEHGWSSWSAPYDYEEVLRKGGVRIVSPSPKRFFQFRIDLKSEDLSSAGMVDSLCFEISKPPVAHKIVAEISPGKVSTGKSTEFTYALMPDIRQDDTGFDRLKIFTPTRIDGVTSVRIGGEEVSFKVIDAVEDHFTVEFPKITSDKLLTVVFKGKVLRYGTLFEGIALNSETGGPGEFVVGGDATPEIGTDDIFVRTALGGPLIGSLEVSPQVLTPNGDGMNDVVSISYFLFQLSRKRPVLVEICHPSGEVVRKFKGLEESGRYTVQWDGRDDSGKVVPPGVYMIRVHLRTDSGEESRVRAICVAY